MELLQRNLLNIRIEKGNKIMTVSEAIRKINRKNPDTVCVFKTERYGMFWSGKVKFATTAFCADTYTKEVKSVEYDQTNHPVITI